MSHSDTDSRLIGYLVRYSLIKIDFEIERCSVILQRFFDDCLLRTSTSFNIGFYVLQIIKILSSLRHPVKKKKVSRRESKMLEGHPFDTLCSSLILCHSFETALSRATLFSFGSFIVVQPQRKG